MLKTTSSNGKSSQLKSKSKQNHKSTRSFAAAAKKTKAPTTSTIDIVSSTKKSTKAAKTIQTKIAKPSSTIETSTVQLTSEVPTDTTIITPHKDLLGLKPMTKVAMKKLTQPEIIYRVAFLRRALSSASQCYYLNKSDQLALSDAEFDKLYTELQQYETSEDAVIVEGKKKTTKNTPSIAPTLISTSQLISTFLSSKFTPKGMQSDIAIPQGLTNIRHHLTLPATPAAKLKKGQTQGSIIESIFTFLQQTPWEQLGPLLPTSVTSAVGHIILETVSSDTTVDAPHMTQPPEKPVKKTRKKSIKSTEVVEEIEEIESSTSSEGNSNSHIEITTKRTKPTKLSRKAPSASSDSSSVSQKMSFDNRTTAQHAVPMLSIQSVFDLKLFDAFTKTNLKAHTSVHQQVIDLFSDLSLNKKKSTQFPREQLQSTNPALAEALFGGSSKITLNTLQPELTLTLLNLFSSSSSDPKLLTTLLSALSPITQQLSQSKATQPRANTPADTTAPLFITSEHKYDGIALSVDFDHGSHTIATTRGDGQQGFNVTETFNAFVGTTTKMNLDQLKADIISLTTQQFIAAILTSILSTHTHNQQHLSHQSDSNPTLQHAAKLWKDHVMSNLDVVIADTLGLGKKGGLKVPTPNSLEVDFPTIASIPSHFLESPQFASILDTISTALPAITKAVAHSIKTQTPEVWDGSMNVRGEVILPKASWKPGGHYSSPRHFISGLFNSLDDTVPGTIGPETTPTPGVDKTSMGGSKPVHFLPYSLNFTQKDPNTPLQNRDLNPLELATQTKTAIPLVELLTHSQRLIILKNQRFTETPSISAHFQGSTPSESSTPVAAVDSIPIISPPILTNGQMTPTKVVKTPISHYIELAEGNQDNYPYVCDGLVFKTNSVLTQAVVGATAHHPRWAIAPKFQGEYGLTIIKDIGLQVGKSGKVVPVAQLLPVMISGTRIQKVVLHNHNQLINEFFSTVKIGDEVKIEKRGGAIPFISGRGTKTHRDLNIQEIKQSLSKASGDAATVTSDEPSEQDGSKVKATKKATKKITTTTAVTTSPTLDNSNLAWLSNIGKSLVDIVPSTCLPNGDKAFLCPCANQTILEKVENSTGTISASYFCVSELCKDKVVATLSFFVGKNGMDIPAMSTATLESLHTLGLITHKPSTLMRLVVDDRYRGLLYGLGGFTVAQPSIGEMPLLNNTTTKKGSNASKGLETPWDSINLRDVKDKTLPPSQLPVELRPQGFQRKKIENILHAIANQFELNTNISENPDGKVQQILLAYGLTTTHVNALQDLVWSGALKPFFTNNAKQTTPPSSLADALPYILDHIDVDLITTNTTVRAATARDLVTKLKNAKDDIITLASYNVPSLASVKKFY